MQAIVERDEQNCGKDADHPLALRVIMSGISKRGGYTQGMEFLIEYKLKVEDDWQAKKVGGFCDISGMSSAHAIDDADADDYIAESLVGSVPAVKAYLGAQFRGAKISGIIRCMFESAYHRQQDFIL